jgi:nucleoside-diphosphate-sugar epimerase
MKRVLVIGAMGQIGSELVPTLRERYGADNVIASDIRAPGTADPRQAGGPFEVLDCTDGAALDTVIARHRIDTIYHLAAILSATGERDPQRAYAVNMNGLMAVLEVARTRGCSVFTPSSIAAFGPGTPPIPPPRTRFSAPPRCMA